MRPLPRGKEEAEKGHKKELKIISKAPWLSVDDS
jgi:hypothetical protein